MDATHASIPVEDFYHQGSWMCGLAGEPQEDTSERSISVQRRFAKERNGIVSPLSLEIESSTFLDVDVQIAESLFQKCFAI